MVSIQSDIERGLKDVKEQREQLYRMLEVLRAQGIELGPNLSVLKTDPSFPSKASSSGDVLIYSEVNTPSSSPSASSLAAPGSSGSASGIRKSSSMTSSSSAIMTPSNNVMTGGSLKKESLANLHLMSATNETSKALGGDKHEIKQQIPVKLSSLSKDLSSKISKRSTLGASASTSSLTSSKGISNLAVKTETIQQMLPFKLSEDSKVSPNATGASSGPSTGKHKFSQYYHQFDQQQQQPHIYHHQGGSLRYTNSNNTLPKSSGNIQKVTNYGTNSGTGHSGGGGGGGSSGANSDDDKVIYF